MPTNCGLLQIGTPSPSSQFRQSESEIADSLCWIFEIFPFSGDSDRETGFDQDCVAGLGVLGSLPRARPPAKSLASSPPNPRADEDRDVGRGGMIVGP